MYKILFIDSVTTGMNPEKCAIYRLGGIYTVDGAERKRFEIRTRPFPNARVSDQSLWICGETRSSLICYPSQEDAFKDFVKLLDSFVNLRNPKDKLFIGGFNTDRFEYPFIREWFRRCGNERFRDYFHVQTVDMMSIANLSVIESRSGMPDFQLETAARHLGVPVPGEDRYDCVANSKICLDMFRLLARRWGVSGCPDKSVSKDCFRNF